MATKPDFVEAYGNLGSLYMRLGDSTRAEEQFRRVCALRPQDPAGWNSLATALIRQDRQADAEQVLRAGLKQCPDDPAMLNTLGSLLRDLDRVADAEACYRDAVRSGRSFAPAYRNLLDLLEKQSRLEDAAVVLDAARRDHSGTPFVALFEARLLFRQGRLTEARDHLEALAPSSMPVIMRARRSYLLGDIHDRLGDAGQAFAAFTAANACLEPVCAEMGADKHRYLDRIGRYERAFADTDPSSWTSAWCEDGRDDPVFMVGFPRSGTTLLDAMLRGHPDIAVVEEAPTVDAMRRGLEAMAGQRTPDLTELNGEQLRTLRRTYFAALDHECAKTGIEPGPVVIDKMPLNIIEAGLIRRVLPRARFVLALRHPCDCVLSCYKQDFGLNDAMSNFLRLDDSARLYDRCMTLWMLLSERLKLPVHTIRYEDVVSGPKGELQRLLGFLRLSWNDSVLEHDRTAMARGQIRTPSYAQVTERLYSRATYRWERYRAQLKPILPLVLPWAEQFGYPSGTGPQPASGPAGAQHQPASGQTRRSA